MVTSQVSTGTGPGLLTRTVTDRPPSSGRPVLVRSAVSGTGSGSGSGGGAEEGGGADVGGVKDAEGAGAGVDSGGFRSSPNRPVPAGGRLVSDEGRPPPLAAPPLAGAPPPAGGGNHPAGSSHPAPSEGYGVPGSGGVIVPMGPGVMLGGCTAIAGPLR